MSETGEIIYLVVSSYAGIVPGAIHYYGKLEQKEWKEDIVYLKYKMTERQAIQFTKRDGQGYQWHRGDKSERFDTEDHLRAVAIAEYKGRFPNAVALVEGSPSVCGPHFPLDGPPTFMEKALELWTVADTIGWWDDPENDDTMEKLWAEWKELLARYEVEPEPSAAQEPELPEETALPEPEPRKESKSEPRRPTIPEWYATHEHEELTLTLPCRTTMGDDGKGGREGFVEFTVGRCTVSDPKTGEELGSINGGLSASVWIYRKNDDRSWRIGADDIWYAFEKALKGGVGK